MEEPELITSDYLEIDAQDPQANDDPFLTAMPTSQWGNPDVPGFIKTYLVYTTFMGKKIPWHKWALIPLKKVEAAIKASGTKYNFYDVGTYNNRNIAGTNTKSNHAWATAMDINPKENPYIKHHAVVTDIPVVVREAFKKNGFRWGGDYKSVTDAMHFEYLGDPVKSQESDLPEFPLESRVLHIDTPLMRGTDVQWVQDKLDDCAFQLGKVDGIYGTLTREAIVQFQKKIWPKNTKQWDGIVGPLTWTKLLAAETVATYLNRVFLLPRKSLISGDMIVALREWYGIAPLWTLVILGAETSLGRPEDALSKVYNFGCMKAGLTTTPWGKLASGTIMVNNIKWFTFPTAWAGMTAWGRLIKIEYLDLLMHGGVQAAVPKYYGVTVDGYSEYLENIKHLETAFRTKLAAYWGGTI